MEANLQNLCNIIRAHISKYTFIVAQCGGHGSNDTAKQLTDRIELLVTSVRILRNQTSTAFGRKLTGIMQSFLHQTEKLVRTLREGEDSSVLTGMVWKHLDDLKAMQISPLEATWKRFEDMQKRMKDVLDELKQVKEDCILIEGSSVEEEILPAHVDVDEEDFDALFDDGPEHLTKDGLARVDLCISTINLFRRTFLDIYVWTQKGLKYNPERHDAWLLSLTAQRKNFLRNLDMWGASLHEPQDPMEIEQESSQCINNFEDLVNAAQTLQSFARRKFVTRKRGKKISGTGKEWFSNIADDISGLRTQIHSLQNESSV